MKFKGEDELDELHRRIKDALDRWQTITPDMIQALWQSGDMSRPTSRQIGHAARMLVLSGEIEIFKERIDGRTVTYYVRLKK